ncbi:hypothetical protein, partial [Streptomyces sp. NPDC058305]|uniref:hypothetical protein n=1 Tax=Streptomyces sp. NPDC058305 TaxID=3346438 RepID=UPI0036ECFFDC
VPDRDSTGAAVLFSAIGHAGPDVSASDAPAATADRALDARPVTGGVGRVLPGHPRDRPRPAAGGSLMLRSAPPGE